MIWVLTRRALLFASDAGLSGQSNLPANMANVPAYMLGTGQAAMPEVAGTALVPSLAL